MELQRKLEILIALTSDTWFPRGKVHRDGASLIATNGMQILAFHFSAEDEQTFLSDFPMLGKRAKEESETPNKIRELLRQERITRDVNLQALLEFLRFEEYLRCPRCSGSGRRPINENALEEILADDPFEDSRPVDIAGALMDGNLLVGVLAHLPGSETVSLATWIDKTKIRNDATERHILRLAGDGWTLIQVGMKPGTGYEIEVFPMEAK